MHLIAESILDESMPSLNAKIQYIREAEKKIEDISVEIDNLTTALSKLQVCFWPVYSFSCVLLSDLFQMNWLIRKRPCPLQDSMPCLVLHGKAE